jgi:serine/threonine protein phosphatase 1
MRTFVIADVHGSLKTLRSLIDDLIELRKGDTLIFVGDIIDRGPDSKGVIDYLWKLGESGYTIKVMKGNHEDYMAKVYREEESKKGMRKVLGLKSDTYKQWMLYGGEQTMDSFAAVKVTDIPVKYIEWIESLDYYLEWDKFLIVHAGFNFANEDIFSDKISMMWIRDFAIDPVKLGDRKIIHGHLPVTLEFIYEAAKSSSFRFIDLDNGVYLANKPGYGNLMALQLETLELFVQPTLDF